MSTPIEGCRPLFKFMCPKQWDNLSQTQEDGVRFCDRCRKNVYLCTSMEEVRKHAGDCIAVMGRYSDPEPNPEKTSLKKQKTLLKTLGRSGYMVGEPRRK